MTAGSLISVRSSRIRTRGSESSESAPARAPTKVVLSPCGGGASDASDERGESEAARRMVSSAWDQKRDGVLSLPSSDNQAEFLLVRFAQLASRTVFPAPGAPTTRVTGWSTDLLTSWSSRGLGMRSPGRWGG